MERFEDVRRAECRDESAADFSAYSTSEPSDVLRTEFRREDGSMAFEESQWAQRVIEP
jgi:hypothetical protein